MHRGTTPFERPLGLVLAGGAAHGAWQAGCLEALVQDHGLAFDAVIGISVGSLNATGYFLGLMDELRARWLAIGDVPLLRLAPRLWPVSLCDFQPLWNTLEPAGDEAWARQAARCRLTVVCLDWRTRQYVYARYSPGGGDGSLCARKGKWDAPLRHHLAASCAMPYIFPPVRVPANGGTRLLIDGGAFTLQAPDFSDLADCRDVIIIEMDHPSQFQVESRPLIHRVRPRRFTYNFEMIARGIASLRASPRPPRIHRFHPSRPLMASSLEFRSPLTQLFHEQGRADARELVERSVTYRVA